jgi:hypothetical protein
MTKKQQKFLFLGLFLLLIGFGIYQNTDKFYSLKKSGKVVEMVIIDYKFVYKATYNITYKYVVDNKEYIGTCRTSYFKCENGKDGCLGKKFKVIYLPKDPSINEVILGKYNKFKKESPRLF